MRLRTAFITIATLLVACNSANAQTGRRLGLGAGPSWAWYQDDNFTKKNPGVGFIYRFSWSPHVTNGWHLEPSASATWEHVDFTPNLAGAETKVGTLRSIPLMVGGGPAYRHDRTKVGFAVEAGPSLHKFAMASDGPAAYEERTGVPLESIDTESSLAVRGGVAVWQDLSDRFGLRVGTSYFYNRPNTTTTAGGVTTTEKWKLDYTSVSAGLIVGFF